MGDVPREQIDSWVAAVGRLHTFATRDPADARPAREAVANLWSEFGYQDAPVKILEMFVQAIEVEYAAALRDLRDGDFDDLIREWRPDAFES